jgi:hypothetical protein
MTPIRASIVGPPLLSATRIKASTAVCHSSICCSAFGSFWIYLAASSRVTSWRPHGRGMGSSNWRFQPRTLMAPTLLIGFSSKTLRRPWRRFLLARIAPRTQRAGGATGAGVLAFPRSIGMGFTNPAAVLTDDAFHRSPLLPRITLRADLAMPRGPKGSGQAWRVLGTPSRVGPPSRNPDGGRRPSSRRLVG